MPTTERSLRILFRLIFISGIAAYGGLSFAEENKGNEKANQTENSVCTTGIKQPELCKSGDTMELAGENQTDNVLKYCNFEKTIVEIKGWVQCVRK